MSNENVVLTSSRGFLNCLQACLAKIKNVKSDDIRGACTQSTCFMENMSAGHAYSIEVTYVWSFYIKNVCARDVCIGDICDVNTVKCLEIYLQSFQILEMRLFSTRLEIRVETG